MKLAIWSVLLFLAAEPFWTARPPSQWTDAELTSFLTDSPWAQFATAPGTGMQSAPALVFLATAAPMLQAEEERQRRALAKQTKKAPIEEEDIAGEYRLWLDENRISQIVLAIRIPDAKAFSDEREILRMEKESVMLIGRKKVQMTGHFPPSASDPYLRLAFPRQVQLSDKTLNFDLYLPGVSVPYRRAEFVLKDMVVNGRLEL